MPDRPTEHFPTILFGAFDRHNLGDLLFPHVLTAMLGDRALVFAGLQERDMRPYGGHRVRAIGEVAAELGGRPANIVHAGGELLTCDAWQAAVMLQSPGEAANVIARLDLHPAERREWARRTLQTDALAPYCLGREAFPHAACVVYHAVGGTGLADCDPALRDEVLARLRTADQVTVRDGRTLITLRTAGIPARLVPDPAVMVAALFGERIRDRGASGEVGEVRSAFPQGYLAVQFSADFGDDQTLGALAMQLRHVAAEAGLGVALFRAGAAPWHDELEVYERLLPALHGVPVRIMASLDVWDICALVAFSRGYLGSSLHGRIVATAFALPRVSLAHPDAVATPGKLAAVAETWEDADMPAVVAIADVADGLRRALTAGTAGLERAAARLVANYRDDFLSIRAALR